MRITNANDTATCHDRHAMQAAAALAGRGDPSGASLHCPADDEVILADGSVCNLGGLGLDNLQALQWQQEREFARQILAAPKGSVQRSDVTCHAYNTVIRILARARGSTGGMVVMGMHPRQGRLVLELLRRQQRRGQAACFFEIGYGTGSLLKMVAAAGFSVGGIEVVPALRQQAVEQIGPQHAGHLFIGDFLKCTDLAAEGPWSVVYWNDVFEHIPPDEIGDWLQRICGMLAPGGQLVTITPNWHCRPWDATADMCPPRTTAQGLHLKEYTLVEVVDMLYRAGFARVATPLVITPQRVVLGGSGLIGLKRWIEASLERLPFFLAKLICRGFGLSFTIATKR